MNGHEVEPIYNVSSIVLIFQWFVDQVENHNYNSERFGQVIRIIEVHLHLNMQNRQKGIKSM